MRSLSNIIKSGRIRSQSYLDLSQRLVSSNQKLLVDEIEQAESETVNSDDDLIELIGKRREELNRIEEEIQKKLKDADNKVEALLSDAASRCEMMEKEIKDKESEVLAKAHRSRNEMIQQAEVEASQIIEAAQAEKRSLLQSTEGEVVETLITLLKHIISEEMNENVEWLRLVVRKMLMQDQSSDTFKLVVSPYCLQLIEKDQKHFLEGLSKVTTIESNETLNDTSCILETNQGNIEYDVSYGLEKIISEIRILKGLS